jgi:hypothetical protein
VLKQGLDHASIREWGLCPHYATIPREIDPVAAHNFRICAAQASRSFCCAVAGDILILKGNDWVSSDGILHGGEALVSGRGAVHRSPARAPAAEGRFLVILDRMSKEVDSIGGR